MDVLPIFITGNEGKARELGTYLDITLPHQKLDLIEIQSLNLEEIVTYKAKEAYRQVGAPVLIEDTSLTFSALGQLPGPLVKWFLESLGNEGLCRLLNGYDDRRATAQMRFGLYDGREVVQFVGEREGTISSESRGIAGIGWDSIFIPIGANKTWGEMTAEEKAVTSMRRLASEKLAEYLKENLQISE